jgi:hypothetical protein
MSLSALPIEKSREGAEKSPDELVTELSAVAAIVARTMGLDEAGLSDRKVDIFAALRPVSDDGKRGVVRRRHPRKSYRL